MYILSTDQGGAAITHVVPQIHYRGQYPTSPLGRNHSGFTVEARVFVNAPGAVSGVLSVEGEWGVKNSIQCNLTGENQVCSVYLDASSDLIELWWPNGMAIHGSQKLYNLTVTFATAGTVVAEATRRIGFKHFALVTGNDTDPSYVAESVGKHGTMNPALGMFWRVNGAAVFSKGANMMPMDQLEGRLDAQAHRILVKSAADAGFNTLRVWGGGMFLPPSFYSK